MIYVTKILLLAIHFLLTSILGFIFSLIRPFHPNNVYYVGYLFAKIGLKILRIELEIENAHYLKIPGTKIIISNHQSNYDIFFCASMCPKGAVSIGKRSILYFPFFGQLYWITGNILINRKNKRKALSTMSEVEDALMKKKTSVWIMPEGTRSKGRGLLPYKKGAFVCAHNTGRPLIPVCIANYEGKINLNSLKKLIIKVKILPPIINTKSSSPKELAEQAYLLMKSELDQLSAK